MGTLVGAIVTHLSSVAHPVDSRDGKTHPLWVYADHVLANGPGRFGVHGDDALTKRRYVSADMPEYSNVPAVNSTIRSRRRSS